MNATYRILFAPCCAILPVLAAATWQARAQADEEQERVLLASAGQLRLGESVADVRRKLEPPWRFVETNRFLLQSPFRDLVPQTNSAVVSEWQSQGIMRSGWPTVLFVVFDSPAKTKVVDVLLAGPEVHPLVDGVFERNLHSIKKGDSVEKVYALLGRKECRYYRREDGKWRVALLYLGCRGEFIEIEADAGTALVVRVSDVTI